MWHGVLRRMATITPGGTWDQCHGEELLPHTLEVCVGVGLVFFDD